MKYSLYKATYRVIKILLTVLIIFSFSAKITLSSENISCKQDKENHIENITVKIYKDRNWTKNNIKILISNTRTIPKDLRKRFKGEIKVQYTNGSLCVLKAKIRQNGDLKDHFIYVNNNVKQSLDVELTNGNLGGITKFKLLLDGTRGDSRDEIFLTELLRELGFISPRTQFVEAYVNEIKSTMLMQEKSTKEMFEYNDRIESAIFETNENDFFKSLEGFSNNNLTNDEIGLNAILDKATMGQLARQINGKWALKSPMHLEISLRALSNLNSVYINSLNNFKQHPNKGVHNDNFDNTLLGKQNKKNIIKVDQYKLILKATNADHGLKTTNRKFYWNKLENYFEPVYYDGNPVIYINENIGIDLPSSPYINTAIDELSDTLLNLDLKAFNEKLTSRRLNLTDLEVQKKIKIINFNLSKLRTNINNNDSISNQSYEKLKNDSKIIQTAILNKKDNNSNTLFVFKEIGQEFNDSFVVCTTYNSCKKREFTKIEQSKILTGNFFENKREYIYIGYYSNLEIKSEVEKFNFINFKDSEINFYYNDGIQFDFDKEKNEFNIVQLRSEARAYFINSNIKNLDIKFNGLENLENLFYLPFDLKGLTGCLTFFNSNFKNVNLKSFNSNCEDSINMVNVKGEIKNVNIKNSYSDALDIDFSHVNIENIDITGSRNDCVDVSFGKYDFTFLNLDKCGDKGLSVGEKSEIIVNKITIDNSKLGIASKDGSLANIFHANIKNVKTCLASYNKKPEFSGGYIKIDKFICENYVNKNVIDDYSKILLLK